MNRQEFLNTLRSQLSGAISSREVEENIRYYDEYIRDAVENGKSESQILNEIGSPFLIARTIIETSNKANGAGYQSQGQGSSYQQDENDNRRPESSFRSFNLQTGVPKWLIITGVVVILVVILSILGSAIAILSRFFIPIVVIVLVIALVKGRGRR
ncbi:DUF1700 domain-containing protein [uncultured Robinsoniella sp.]|uniref:DUF1700 domain-containing protein n=1 Tax=uncultured Robinsoniella sp. TaxID=904190 RepID=UPI00374EBEAA